MSVCIVSVGSVRDDWRTRSIESVASSTLDVEHIQCFDQRGLAEAVNRAIHASTSDYIVVVRDSDTISPGFAQRVVDAFADESVRLVVPTIQLVTNVATPPPTTPYSIGYMLLKNMLPISSAFRRADALRLGGWDVTNADMPDYQFWLTLIADGAEPAFLSGAPDVFVRVLDGANFGDYGCVDTPAGHASAMRAVPDLYETHVRAFLFEMVSELFAVRELSAYKKRYGRLEHLISRAVHGARSTISTLKRKVRK